MKTHKKMGTQKNEHTLKKWNHINKMEPHKQNGAT